MAPFPDVFDSTRLGEYVTRLRNLAEYPEFRYTQKGLEQEMCEQRSAWREANWIGENLVNEQQPVWAELESIQNKIVDNEVKIDYLMCITEMEQLFSKFTTITAANARELATKASAAEHSKHDLEHEVDLCWANVQRYAGLVNIHVRHAAEYHRFYHFVNQVNIKISRVSEQLNKMLHENDFKNCGGTPDEARQLANILKNTLHQYESIEAQCERIDNRCQSIVPVNLRAQPLLHEVDGIMLCDYDANNFKFRAGDRIEVVRNWTPFKCDVNSHGMNGTPQSGLIQEQPNVISSETETSPNAQNTVIRFGAFPLGSNSLPEGSKNLVNNTTPYWCVRTVENAAIYAVPAVAVCLLPPASDAVTVAKDLKMKLLESWKHTIDLLFNLVIAFLRQFLRMIKDSETYMVADYDALQRLFALIQESCSREKDEIFDTELAKLLEVAQTTSFETYEQTPGKSNCFLRRSDIAQYMSVIATLSMLTHKSEIFELRCKSGATFRKLGEQVDHEVKRMLLSVNTINEIARLDLFKVQKLLVELRRLQTMGSSQEQTNTKRSGFSRSISDDQDDLEVAHFSDPVFWSLDARPNASCGRTQSQPVTGQPAGAFRSNYLFIRQFTVRGPNYSLSRTSLPLDQNRWSSDCEWETPYVKSVYSRSTSITEAGRYGLSGSVCHTQSSWVSARLSPDRDLLQSPHRSVSFVSKVPNYHVEYSISIPPASTCAQTQTDNQGIEEQFRYLDREQNSYPFRRIQLDDIKPPQEKTQLTEDGRRQLEEPEGACFSQRITSPIYKRRLNRNKRKQRTLGGKGETAEPTERRDENGVDENMMKCTTEQEVKAETTDERTISTMKVKQSKRRASIETKATISLSAAQQRENHLCTNCTTKVSKCSTLAVENSTQYATDRREQNTQTDIMHSTTHSTKLTGMVEADVVQTKSTTTNIIYATTNGTAATGATDTTAEKPTTATENGTPRSMKDNHLIKNQSTMCHTSTQYTTKHTPTTITAIECATVAMTTEPIRAEIQHREEQTKAPVVEGITQMTKQIVPTKETQTQTQKTTHSFRYVNTSTAKVSELVTINSAHTQPENCEQGAQTDCMHVVIDDGHLNEYFGTTHSTSPLRISLSISPTNCIHCRFVPARLPVASSFPVLCTVSSCYAKRSYVSSPCFPVSFLSNMHTFLSLLCSREPFSDSPNFPAFTSQISLHSLPSYLLQFSSRSLGLQRHFSAPHIGFSDSMFPQHFRIHRSVRDFWCQFSAFRHAMVDCFVAKYTLNLILEARPGQTNLITDPFTQTVPVSTPSFAIRSDDRTMSDAPLSPAQFTEIPVLRDVGISVQVDLADFGVLADLPQCASEPVFSVHNRWDGLPSSKAFVESTLFAWPKTACMGTQTLNKADRFYTPITKSNPSFLLVVDASADYCRPITTTHLIWGSQSLDLISETLDESENQSFDDEFSYPDQHRYGVNLEAIRCRVRQRTVQYELLDINRTLELTRIDWVDEVVSPITGLLSPVEKAIKAGWLVSDESGDYYVDTEAEQRIPLHMAVSKGLVRLRSPDKMDISNTDSFDSRSLLIIERITCTWCPVRIISYLDTLNKVRCTINEALQNGWIELKTGEPLILDRATQRWITTEEAAGRGVVQIVPIDASECYHDPLEETYSFRVFRIVAVRPGGEPNRWLEPAEAVRLGLFNWQTGEVASEWDEFVTEREQIEPSWDEPGQLVPTKWLSLLEARKARWVRLRAVTYPNEIVQKQANTPLRHSSHRILSTHVHLVAPRSIFVGPSPEGDNVSSSSIRSRSGIISPVSISSVSCNQWPSNGMSVQPSGSTACASTASSRAKPLRSAQNPEKWSSTFSYRLRTREIQKHSSRSVQRIYRSFVPERSNRLLVERDPIDSAA